MEPVNPDSQEARFGFAGYDYDYGGDDAYPDLDFTDCDSDAENSAGYKEALIQYKVKDGSMNINVLADNRLFSYLVRMALMFGCKLDDIIGFMTKLGCFDYIQHMKHYLSHYCAYHIDNYGNICPELFSCSDLDQSCNLPNKHNTD